MATVRQKKAAKLYVENMKAEKPKTKQQIAEEAGYSLISADRNVHDIFDSKGVKSELVILGFNAESAKRVVSEILENGENHAVKLKAADMIFKVDGTYAAEKHVNLNIDLEETERVKELTEQLNALHGGGGIGSDGETSNPLG